MYAHRGPWFNHLDGLEQQFDILMEINGLGDNDRGDKKFVKILRDLCDVVRDAEKRRMPELAQIIERAHQVIEKLLRYAYSDGLFSQVHCFAYSDYSPLVGDSLKMAGADMIETFMEFYTNYLYPGIERPKLPAFARTESWIKSPRPHPQTSRLSRFRKGVTIDIPDSAHRAQLIYQARAQVQMDFLSPPCTMQLSTDGAILAMAVASGYKGHDPILRYYRLGDDGDEFYDLDCDAVQMDPGLSNVARWIEMDSERKLIFLADDDRIKSFSWGPNADDELTEVLPNVHTMNSEREYDGPLAVLPGGRLIRAGKGKVAVWNLDTLETHQDNPGKLIGEGTVNTDNSFREEDCKRIERSSGSKAHSIITFADAEYQPRAWHWHAPTGLMLCAENGDDDHRFGCVSMDIEQGRHITRYLGHGHDVDRFSTSSGDPHVFWTAGSDGYARMFDVRRPLPVLTFDTGVQSEACADVLFIHPDGIPTLFTGGQRTQQIKLWDVRARACIYEFSTGNNGVCSLLWDDRRMDLIAATESGHGWGPSASRKAKIPRWATWKAVEEEAKARIQAQAASQNEQEEPLEPSANDGRTPPAIGAQDVEMVVDTEAEHTDEAADDEDAWTDESESEGESSGLASEGQGQEEDDDDEDEDNPNDIDEEYSEGRKWPQRAYHNERFFGYAFSAGRSVFLRYQFRVDPSWDLPTSSSERWL
ncbi:hypothetical protein C8Q74DRAFT_1315373 [Fomes fomentarius]|nr:hypothetical protein C8Q74DRAFT_1315373 [Fomes fomentarius]